MKAIEFVTHAENGTIKIPKKYLKELDNELRVIILIDKNNLVKKTKKTAGRIFKAMSVKTKGLIDQPSAPQV